MKIALIDADVNCFQAAVVSEKATNWGDGMWTLHADEGVAERAFQDSIARIVDAVGADKLILALSDDVNWRKEVLPTYKANREDKRAPMLRRHMVQFAKDNYETFQRPTLEGDDVLGILLTRPSKDDLVVCSIDKDMKTLPGKHFNFGKNESFFVSEDEANYWHLYQTLVGDATDNYSGCPGIGPVAATKVLSPFMSMHGKFDYLGAWEAVLAQYEKKGLGVEEALTQARVARICRVQDYNFKTKKVILWTPPK